MTNEKLAQSFADGATKGKNANGSMFIEGDKIYSYGYHFVIAQRVENGFLFTNRKYSNTTAKHKNSVLQALATTGKAVEKIDELK